MTRSKLTFLSFAIFIIFISLLTMDCSGDIKKRNSTNLLSNLEKSEYIKKGNEISALTFSSLAAALQGAMVSGGVQNAIQFCNISALPITDSLSQVHNAQIRRTSLQWRNSVNKPDKNEKTKLLEYEKTRKSGKELLPDVNIAAKGIVAYYAPIMVNDFCLQCHGTLGKELSEFNYSLIKEAYPDDRAIGYMRGDLRGMWSIQFKR